MTHTPSDAWQSQKGASSAIQHPSHEAIPILACSSCTSQPPRRRTPPPPECRWRRRKNFLQELRANPRHQLDVNNTSSTRRALLSAHVVDHRGRAAASTTPLGDTERENFSSVGRSARPGWGVRDEHARIGIASRLGWWVVPDASFGRCCKSEGVCVSPMRPKGLVG